MKHIRDAGEIDNRSAEIREEQAVVAAVNKPIIRFDCHSIVASIKKHINKKLIMLSRCRVHKKMNKN